MLPTRFYLRPMSNHVSADHAVSLVKSGHRVFVHGSAATPLVLMRALFARAAELSNVELVSISTIGALDLQQPEVQRAFFMNSLFVSDNVRGAVERGTAGVVHDVLHGRAGQADAHARPSGAVPAEYLSGGWLMRGCAAHGILPQTGRWWSEAFRRSAQGKQMGNGVEADNWQPFAGGMNFLLPEHPARSRHKFDVRTQQPWCLPRPVSCN